MLEAPKIMNDPAVTFSPFVLITNASAAFGKSKSALIMQAAHSIGVLSSTSVLACHLPPTVRSYQP